MSKTITVKGVGKVKTAPDFVVLSMDLESTDMDYEKAMNQANKSIEALNEALESVGFEKGAVKTTNFNVRTDYDYRHKEDGMNERVFLGYVVSQSLKLEFDFETKRLANALSAVSACLAHPEISIAFTVKDATGIKEELLTEATKNARQKAEILCAASQTKLGELVSINYSWSEINLFSNMRFSMADECMAMPSMAKCSGIEMTPDDIESSDTATFVWEIL